VAEPITGSLHGIGKRGTKNVVQNITGLGFPSGPNRQVATSEKRPFRTFSSLRQPHFCWNRRARRASPA
jgi:hypothetical protein